MKYIYKIVLLSFVFLGLTSCDENENFEILPPQDGITLNSPIDGSSIALIDTNEQNPGLTVSWNSANLKDSGATYNVEVALTGTDFSAPTVIGSTTNMTLHLTVEELNNLALDVLQIPAESEASIEIRVTSGDFISNKVSVLLTPYKIEFTELFLVGSLTNWKPEESLPMTRTGFNEFLITIDLADGDEFKFLPQNTGWDGDFGEDPNNPGKLVEEGEQNIAGYPAGKYDVTVNLNDFTFNLKPILAPENLYLVGSINGWDNATALPLFKSGENTFSIVVDLPDGAEFKFLPTQGSWDGDWGADKNNAGSIVQDDEDNIKGYTGKYLVTVDYNNLTYKLTPVGSLFTVGSINGWNNGAALPMAEASLGIFTIVLDLPDGAEFKFLPNNGSWDGDWGASKTEAGRIVQDDEDNLKGYEAGKYVVAVNYNTLSYTVSKINAVPANLFLVGAFNGWSNTAGNPKFTQTSAGVFEITQALSANDEFKFVPVAGSWGDDFGESKVASKVLEQNDENNLKVTTGGNYKITVNFNKGNISVVSL